MKICDQWRKKARWDPLARYYSTANSFPDYGAPGDEAKMKSRIRAINDQKPRSSMGGGQSTEARSYYSEPRDDRPNKRVKPSGPELSNTNLSRFFPTGSLHRPQEAIEDEEPQTSRQKYHDLTREDSMVETIDGSSIISFGRTAGATSNQQEYRNVHRQNSVKRTRRRRRHESKISSSPIEIDDTSAVAHRNLAPQTSHPPTSPDQLARENEDGPPPANITSDVVSQPKRPATEYSQSAPKRFKVHPQQSDDELAPRAPGGRETVKKPSFPKLISQPRTQRGDIQPTTFKTTKAMPGRETLANKGSALKEVSLEAAICGKYSFSPADNIEPVTLRLGPDAAEPMHENSGDLSWLQVLRSSVKGVKHNNTNSPIVLISRSARTSFSCGKLALKFVSDADASFFIHWLHGLPCLVQHDTDKLDATFHCAKKEADGYRTNSAKASGIFLPDDSHRANSARPQQHHKDPFLGDPVSPGLPASKQKKLKDGMQSIFQPKESVQMEPLDTDDLFTGLARNQRLGTRHLTRRESPQSQHERTPKPWTACNPGWEKKWHRSLVWPPTGKNRATVDKDDIQRLDEGEFLNDNIISFYLRYLQDQLEKQRPEVLKKVYIFSTFFFEKLRSNRGKINYDGVKAWTARVELLSYEFIVVPVNENAHWYLAIIYNAPRLLQQEVKAETNIKESSSPQDAIIVEDNDPVMNLAESPPAATKSSIVSIDVEVIRLTRSRAINDSNSSLIGDKHTPNIVTPGKTSKRQSTGGNQKFSLDDSKIITLDSLGSSHAPTCRCLKDYLLEEAKHKKGLEIASVPSGMTARGIPMQDNFCDCGVYVLGYMENFLKDPDEAVRRLLHKEDTEWEINAPEIRAKVRDLLFECQEKQHERLEKEKEIKRQRRATKGPVSSPQIAASSPQVPRREPETPQVSRYLTSPSVNGASGSPFEAARQTGTTSSYFAVASAERPGQSPMSKRNDEPSLVQRLREDSGNESKASSSGDVYHSARSSPINSVPPVPSGLTTEGSRDERTPKQPSTPEFVHRLPDSPDDMGPTATSSTVKKTSSPLLSLVTRQHPSPGSQGSQRAVQLEQTVVRSIEDDMSPPRGPQYDGVDQSIDLTV
ncbi:Ubiquitin-like-specific protease 2 [Fusarium oxysporum f. sp. rapae]|uniref:Ubiquitin-like-specific protease 2 n=1 Tax=Fusarium oxysporum f. sp. rapae TaxID=485398 RepID=A0A8J5U2L8_FUSOX|nr:Ubiquitin-like-specific protease 2 [Fusarium oxysporum f. sp. rapae]